MMLRPLTRISGRARPEDTRNSSAQRIYHYLTSLIERLAYRIRCCVVRDRPNLRCSDHLLAEVVSLVLRILVLDCELEVQVDA